MHAPPFAAAQASPAPQSCPVQALHAEDANPVNVAHPSREAGHDDR